MRDDFIDPSEALQPEMPLEAGRDLSKFADFRGRQRVRAILEVSDDTLEGLIQGELPWPGDTWPIFEELFAPYAEMLASMEEKCQTVPLLSVEEETSEIGAVAAEEASEVSPVMEGNRLENRKLQRLHLRQARHLLLLKHLREGASKRDQEVANIVLFHLEARMMMEFNGSFPNYGDSWTGERLEAELWQRQRSIIEFESNRRRKKAVRRLLSQVKKEADLWNTMSPSDFLSMAITRSPLR